MLENELVVEGGGAEGADFGGDGGGERGRMERRYSEHDAIAAMA